MMVKGINYEEAKETLQREKLDINIPAEIQDHALPYKVKIWRKNGKLFLWEDFRGFFMIEKED